MTTTIYMMPMRHAYDDEPWYEARCFSCDSTFGWSTDWETTAKCADSHKCVKETDR